MDKTTSESLKSFLASAKRGTYASLGDSASVTPLLPGSLQLEYVDEPWLYRDIYVGMSRFIGQEIVYFSGKAVWSMSYAGGLTAALKTTDVGSIYDFLRKALRQIDPRRPFRGPAILEEDDLVYACRSVGTVMAFHGTESIRRRGSLVYELRFSGGSVE